jgi:predicted esterase
MTGDRALPDAIVRYVAARDQERAERVDAALAAMTDRERALVREAAVMGYVQGAMYASGGAPTPPIPPDAAVVARVVAACQSMEDLYPNLGGESP